MEKGNISDEETRVSCYRTEDNWEDNESCSSMSSEASSLPSIRAPESLTAYQSRKSMISRTKRYLTVTPSSQRKACVLEFSGFHEEQLQTFRWYVDVGREMNERSQEGYTRSAFAVKSIEEIFESLRLVPFINYFDHKYKPKAFYDIQAPRLIGKTQLAFALRRRRPLYFVCSCQHRQPIYDCFRELNEAMAAFAENDLKKIGASQVSDIGAFKLSKKHNRVPFHVVGLLHALLVLGHQQYSEGTNDNWMTFYASIRRISVSAMSLDEFIVSDAFARDRLDEKYILFLDEFAACPGSVLRSVFVRNAGRSAYLEVVSAGVNVKAAHEVEMKLRPAYRHWCVVILRLPPTSASLIRRAHTVLSTLSLDDRMKQFLLNQVVVSRGGVATLIVLTLELLPSGCTITEAECLRMVIDEIRRVLEDKKGGLVSNEANRALAKLCLGNHYAVNNLDMYSSSDGVRVGRYSPPSPPPLPYTNTNIDPDSASYASTFPKDKGWAYMASRAERSDEFWNDHHFHLQLPPGSENVIYINTTEAPLYGSEMVSSALFGDHDKLAARIPFKSSKRCTSSRNMDETSGLSFDTVVNFLRLGDSRIIFCLST